MIAKTAMDLFLDLLLFHILSMALSGTAIYLKSAVQLHDPKLRTGVEFNKVSFGQSYGT